MASQALLAADGVALTRDRCQVCGAKVVVKNTDEIVIKNAILRVDSASGRVSAKCSRCKAWVAVPLTYTG